MEDQSFCSRMEIKNEKLMQLYSFPTPNGIKVAVALEEIIEILMVDNKGNLNISNTESEEEKMLLYEPHAVNIRIGENRMKLFDELGFHNHKIPGLIDPTCYCPPPCPCPENDLSKCCCRVSLFESGSILLYLAEKYNQLIPNDKISRINTINWLFYGSVGVSNQFKLFGFYYKYCSHGIPYCVERYTKEVHHLLNELNTQLSHGKHWIIGDSFTIADISIWPWVYALFENFDNAGQSTFDIPHMYSNVHAWYLRCLNRPASKRALDVCKLNYDLYSNY